MNEDLLKYYAGDPFPADVWKGKYAVEGEKTPNDMHMRMSSEIGEKEWQNLKSDKEGDLSVFGRKIQKKLKKMSNSEIIDWVNSYLVNFKYVIPQGSIMSMLGHPKAIGSLSNCFVIPAPLDSYAGIFFSDQQLAQLEKRRGGVGTNLNNLRPEDMTVLNSAGTSTGAHSFMDRYSNTTREVAQNGRK